MTVEQSLFAKLFFVDVFYRINLFGKYLTFTITGVQA